MHLYKRSNIYYIKFKSADGSWKNISTKTSSKQIALKFLSEFDRKEYDNTSKGTIPFNSFITKYLEYSKIHHSPSNTVRINYVIKHFSSIIQPVLLSDVKTTTLEKYKSVRMQSVKPTTMNIELRALKAMFNKAVSWDFLESNPFKNVSMVRVQEKFPAYLSEVELGILLKLNKLKWLSDLIIVAFYTGMRRNELLNLRWRDVYLKEKYILVSNTNEFSTKSKRDRIIPLIDKVIIVLKKIPNTSEFVFVNSGRKKHYPNYITQCFRDLVKKSRIEKKLTFHSLRHSCASNLVSRGASLYNVMKLLGHGDYSTTQIYAHLEKDTLYKTVQLLN